MRKLLILSGIAIVGAAIGAVVHESLAPTVDIDEFSEPTAREVVNSQCPTCRWPAQVVHTPDGKEGYCETCDSRFPLPMRSGQESRAIIEEHVAQQYRAAAQEAKRHWQ